MKNFFSAIIGFAFFSTFAFADKPQYGPEGHPRAVPLMQEHRYLNAAKSGAPDFWNLISYYVGQPNDWSCSVASVVMSINAAKAKLPKTEKDELVVYDSILERIGEEHWKQRVSKEGFNGEHGVPLDGLGRIVEAVFKNYGFPNVKVTVHHVDNASAQTEREIEKDLIKNEASARNLILSNFDQGYFVDYTPPAGHIAPVAAYDGHKKQVLILDPYRLQYEPYWVSLRTFMTGMATKDSSENKNRGYVFIEF